MELPRGVRQLTGRQVSRCIRRVYWNPQPEIPVIRHIPRNQRVRSSLCLRRDEKVGENSLDPTASPTEVPGIELTGASCYSERLRRLDLDVIHRNEALHSSLLRFRISGEIYPGVKLCVHYVGYHQPGLLFHSSSQEPISFSCEPVISQVADQNVRV